MGLNAGLTVHVALGTGVWVGDGVGVIVGEHVIGGVGFCALLSGTIAKAKTTER